MSYPSFLSTLGRLVLCLCAFFVTSTAFAQLTLHPLFADGAVLQRETAVPIWGWASPGTAVTVVIASQTLHTVADAGGRWTVTTAPLAIAGIDSAITLTVSTENESITRSNILVGEVWWCSGQSNMDARGDRVAWSGTAARLPEPGFHPETRIIQIQTSSTGNPLNFLDPLDFPVVSAGWRAAGNPVGTTRSPAEWFGLALYHELGIPVGIILAAFGGSTIESWIPESAIGTATQRVQDVWHQRRLNWQPFIDEMEEAEAAGDVTTTDRGTRLNFSRQYPGINANGGIYPIAPFAVRGLAWYQGENNNGDPEGYYREALECLFTDWRGRIGQPELPLIIVQIASIWTDDVYSENLLVNVAGPSPTRTMLDSQQAFTNADAHAFLVPNVDLGGQLHPATKPDVGVRMSLSALAGVYGRSLESNGPRAISLSRSENTVTLHFAHGSGLFAAEGLNLDPTTSPLPVLGENGVFLRNNSRVGRLLVYRQGPPMAARGIYVTKNGNPNRFFEVAATVIGTTIVCEIPSDAETITGGLQPGFQNNYRMSNIYNGALLPMGYFDLPLSETVEPIIVPLVTLTSPASSAMFLLGDTVHLSASVSFGSFASVEFYVGGILYTTANVVDNVASTTWTTTGTGEFQLSARALEAGGEWVQSAPIPVEVVDSFAPVAHISAAPTSGNAPLTVEFNASASFHPQGTIVSYEWDFDGDGIVDASGPITAHVFPEGTHNVRLTLADANENTATATVTITVNAEPSSSSDAISINFNAGRVLNANASAGVVPRAFWNNATGGQTLLLGSDGLTSGARVTTDAANGYSATLGGESADHIMMSQHRGRIGNRTDYVFEGIPYDEYDVYVYWGAFGVNEGPPNFAKFSIDTETYWIRHDVRIWDGNFVRSTAPTMAEATHSSYVVFEGRTGSSFTLISDSNTRRVGPSGIQIINRTLPEPADDYVAWLTQHGFSEDPGNAPQASLAGDGVPNLLRFAVGISPLDPLPPAFAPALEDVSAGPESFIGLRFRLRDPLFGISWTVEESDDLAIWSPTNTSYAESLSHEDGTRTRFIRSTVPLDSLNPRFLRLRLIIEE